MQAALRCVLATEGMSGLFRGAIPRTLRIGEEGGKEGGREGARTTIAAAAAAVALCLATEGMSALFRGAIPRTLRIDKEGGREGGREAPMQVGRRFTTRIFTSFLFLPPSLPPSLPPGLACAIMISTYEGGKHYMSFQAAAS